MNIKSRKCEILDSGYIRITIWIPKHFLTFFFFCFISSPFTNAQSVYGDEWINTSQTYLRILVVKNGFYKISDAELKAAGFQVDEIPGTSFQMFRLGKEVAVEVSNDKSVSFYGQKNDGALDSSLYVYPQAMPHPHYSLYSDTAFYFLTYKQEGNIGKRIAKAPIYKPAKSLDFHFEEVSEIFNSNYSTGNFYPKGAGFETGSALSTYDVGEGWTGKELSSDWQTFDINTSNIVSDRINLGEVELVFVGRSAGVHETEIWSGKQGALGNKTGIVNLSDYKSTTYRFPLSETFLVNGKLVFSVHSTSKTGSISVSYIKWRYPQKSVLPKDLPQKEFFLKSDSVSTIWNTGKTEGWKFYDVSNAYQLRELQKDNSGVYSDGNEKIIGVKETLKTASLKRIRFKPFDSLQIDYLIITHPLVRTMIKGIDPVAGYSEYRASKQGGNYRPLIINSEEVCNRFNYGEPGPLGIRKMIARLNKRLKFVFIIGRSIDPQKARKLANAIEVDMIPNAGWPGSDLALSMGLEGSSNFVPLIPIGRINAENSEEVSTYLQKVKSMESQPATAPWRKNILHLSGGRSREEVLDFKSYVKSFESKIVDSSLGANVQIISKQTDAEVEQFPIHIPVNKGVALMTLFGHSGLDVTDIDIGFASDESRGYRNHPFYPAVIVNGCALGSIFYSTKTISSDWIFSPNNGAVLFLAHTFNGVSSSLKHYTDSFYEVLADSQFVSEPFGVIQKEAIRRNMLAYPDLITGITAQQMNLHGDPAIRIFPARLPDYTFDSTLISINDPSGNGLTVWSDSIFIRIAVINNGRYRKGNYTLLVKGHSESGYSFALQTEHKAQANSDTLNFKIANPFKNTEKVLIEFSIDPADLLSEEDEGNNVIVKEVIISEVGAYPLLPTEYYKTSEKEIELVAQVLPDSKNSEVVFEWDSSGTFTFPNIFKAAVKNLIASHKISIGAKPGQVTFWRVYLPEDVSSPSKSRSITFSTENDLNPKLPEGIAFPLTPEFVNVQEGDTFRTIASFQNVTETPFRDSLEVSISQLSSGKTVKLLLKFPALKEKEMLNVPINLPTIDEIGKHEVLVEFNVKKLPELIYSNNQVSFSYELMPDLIPPILKVNIDGRQIQDREFVSNQPVIDIQVLDENKFLIRNDTTGIEVFLKEDCAECKEQKLSLANANVNNFSSNDFRLTLKTADPLKTGNYSLRIKAQDLSGNEASGYQIRFKVGETLKITNAGLSPNPSKQWFRFYVDMQGFKEVGSVRTAIYDLEGREINLIDHVLRSGRNEWFWQPGNLPAGIYFYRMDVKGNSLISDVAVEGLSGKLIWLR